MNDEQGLTPIPEPADEEHQLRNQHADSPLDDTSAGRLADLEVALDQCWDLLRQRRARRSAGMEPDEAEAPPARAASAAPAGRPGWNPTRPKPVRPTRWSTTSSRSSSSSSSSRPLHVIGW